MNLRTLFSLFRGGQISALWSLSRSALGYYRVAFVSAGLASGTLRRLAVGPVPLDTLAAELRIDPAMHDALEAWLQVGVALGELRLKPGGYVLRGRLSRTLADPKNDAAAALVEEMAYLHNALITQSPDRLRNGRLFTLADQDARVVARSSRLAEPFIHEAIDGVVPKHGPVRLLEIGCGTAAHIRYAASRNPELTAVGVELQDDAAALAAENVSTWNLGARVSIEVGDIRKRNPDAGFDVATLHQNIYYFPVAERVGLLRHVRSFLVAGGRLLLTTVCQGRGPAAAVIDLWGAMTAGCGRLPEPAEMVAQLEEAGLAGVTAARLAPVESFYAFVGTSPIGEPP